MSFMEVCEKTVHIEANGGCMAVNGSRRKVMGRVFLLPLEKTLTKEQMRE